MDINVATNCLLCMLYYNLHDTGGIILHTNSDKMRRDEMGADEVYSKL